MPARVLLIDNYDSFVFNLERYIQELGVETVVKRNDQITVSDVQSLRADAIVLSPGPCTPTEAGICLQLIEELGPIVPMLGVCLGHQAIGAACGGRVIRAAEPVHGRISLVEHSGMGLFRGCQNPLRVARYHSLIVEASSLPIDLLVTARTHEGVIMAFSHRQWPVHGVQFHPESILTQQGHRILCNFLNLAGISCTADDLPGDLPVERTLEDDFYRRSVDPEVFRPF